LSKSQSGSSPTSKKSVKRNTEQTICVTLSFRYNEWSHPLFVEGTICLPREPGREKEQIKEMTQELEDVILDLFGIQILSLLEDEGVWYGGVVFKRVAWYHKYPGDGGEYEW